MGKMVQLPQDHHVPPRKGGHPVLLAGFFACLACVVFNVTVKQKTRTGAVYSISDRTCILSKDQPSFLNSLLHEGPPPGDYRSLWKTVENPKMYGHPYPWSVVSAIEASTLRPLNKVLSTAVRVAKDDTCIDGVASVGRFLTRTSKPGEAYVVTIRVQCGDEPSLDRVVTLEFSRRAACKIFLFAPSPKPRVNIALVYSARKQSLREYLKRIAPLLFADANLKLLVGAQGEDATFAKSLLSAMRLQGSATVVPIATDSRGKFSRSIALRSTIRSVPLNEIVFPIDVDMRFDGEVLRTCRLSARNGTQVWFPVIFMGYPGATSVAYGDGFWKISDYGMACFYRSDFDAVGGWGSAVEKRYHGSGPDDMDLWQRFRDDKRYGVLRSYEPGMILIWHPKKCKRNKLYRICLKRVWDEAGCGEKERARGPLCRQLKVP